MVRALQDPRSGLLEARATLNSTHRNQGSRRGSSVCAISADSCASTRQQDATDFRWGGEGLYLACGCSIMHARSSFCRLGLKGVIALTTPPWPPERLDSDRNRTRGPALVIFGTIWRAPYESQYSQWLLSDAWGFRLEPVNCGQEGLILEWRSDSALSNRAYMCYVIRTRLVIFKINFSFLRC